MAKKQLVRDVKRIALERMEEAARTEDDFREVVNQWDHLDDNRERKERYHEILRSDEIMLLYDKASVSGRAGVIMTYMKNVIPRPLEHYWWRQLLAGDFIDTIYDSPDEIWQLVEDWDVSKILKSLTRKQKEVMYLNFVRLYSATEVARMQNKTDRAVRKLRTATLDKIRDDLYLAIGELVKANSPNLTVDKGIFYSMHKPGLKKATLDKRKDG
jgi:hypothetical protein